jgi:hypothetical protein
MAQKINQVVAVEKPTKQRVYDAVTNINKLIQKQDLFEGFQRTYQPVREDGEKLPPENKIAQQKATDLLTKATKALSELFDISATRDWANCNARADVQVDGQVLLPNAPATFLMFLEKQLTDLHTLVGNLPTLDPAETWAKDENADVYKSPVRLTAKTKKVSKAIVLHPPTKEHPAQTQLVQDDEVVGHWEAVRISGAVPQTKKQMLLERIEKVQRAVKFAHEEANTCAAPDVSAKALLDWIMA